jgi:hypothetical protein
MSLIDRSAPRPSSRNLASRLLFARRPEERRAPRWRAARERAPLGPLTAACRWPDRESRSPAATERAEIEISRQVRRAAGGSPTRAPASRSNRRGSCGAAEVAAAADKRRRRSRRVAGRGQQWRRAGGARTQSAQEFTCQSKTRPRARLAGRTISHEFIIHAREMGRRRVGRASRRCYFACLCCYF